MSNTEKAISSSRRVLISGRLTWLSEHILLSLALLLIGLSTLLSVTNQVTYDFNITTYGATYVDFGPSGAVILQLLAALTLTGTVLLRFLRRKPLPVYALMLWLIGVAVIVWHAAGSMDAMRVGGGWIGATALGFTIYLFAKQSTYRRAVIVFLLALMIPLCMRALYQSQVQHQQTVAAFQADEAGQLAQFGIQKGTPAYDRFIRRLMDPDVEAGFITTNVFASVLLMPLMIGVGVILYLFAHKKWLPSIIACSLWLALLWMGLGQSTSKGAIGAFVIAGGVALFAGFIFMWRARWLKFALPLCFVLLLIGIYAGVGARYMQGIEEGVTDQERSLLFRAMYWQAGFRALNAEGALLGIGPGHFREAMRTYKDVRMPETPEMAHSVWMDWLFAMGIAGLLWIGLSIAAIIRAGWLVGQSRLFKPVNLKRRFNQPLDRSSLAWPALIAGLLLFAAVPLMGSIFAEQGFLPFWFASIMMMGAVIAIGGLLNLHRSPVMQLTIAVGAFAGLLHGQIDLGMTHVMSSPMLFAGLGLAAAGLGEKRGACTCDCIFVKAALKLKPVLKPVVVIGCVGTVAALVWMMRYQVAVEQQLLTVQQKYLAANLDEAVDMNQTMQANLAEINAALKAMRQQRPYELRAWFYQASVAPLVGSRAAMIKTRALFNRLPKDHAMKSQIARAQARMSYEIAIGVSPIIAKAIDAAELQAFERDYKHAIKLDPHALNLRMMAGDIYRRAERYEQMKAVYREALKINEALFLDPVVKLNDGQVEFIRSRLGE